MAKTFPFNVLFWFENDEKIITEIKRTDIQSNDKGLIYKWIRIQKQKQNENENENEERIVVFGFQSMESLADKQVRVFAEGILEWNANEALFNGEKLVPGDAQLVDGNWMEVVAGFLGKHFKRTT